MSHESESAIVRELIEAAQRWMPEAVEDAGENAQIEWLFKIVDQRINEISPAGSGGVGFANGRRARNLVRLVWPVMLQMVEDRKEETRAGWESKYENRHHAAA